MMAARVQILSVTSALSVPESTASSAVARSTDPLERRPGRERAGELDHGHLQAEDHLLSVAVLRAVVQGEELIDRPGR